MARVSKDQEHLDVEDHSPINLAPLEIIFEKKKLDVHMVPNQNHPELRETLLRGKRISCFIVNGKLSLCQPEIFNILPKNIPLQHILQVYEQHQINCWKCSKSQLEELKRSGILLGHVPSCGLITKSEAERLCNIFLGPELHPLDHVKSINKKDVTAFEVYHLCSKFNNGVQSVKCRGVFYVKLFTSDNSTCIECLECHVKFTPQNFVQHGHLSANDKIGVWLLNSQPWRLCLGVSKNQPHYDNLMDISLNIGNPEVLSDSKRKLELLQKDKLEETSAKQMKKEDTEEYPTDYLEQLMNELPDEIYKSITLKTISSNVPRKIRPPQYPHQNLSVLHCHGGIPLPKPHLSPIIRLHNPPNIQLIPTPTTTMSLTPPLLNYSINPYQNHERCKSANRI